MQNPFTPSFGAVPYVFVGRKSLINSIEQALKTPVGDPGFSALIMGSKGTGKTAFLAYIRETAELCGWISVDAKAVPGMLDAIEEQAMAAAKRFGVERKEEPAAPPRGRHGRTEARGASGPSHAPKDANGARSNTWRMRMSWLLDQLKPSGAGLLITVDGIQDDSDDVSRLLSACQYFAAEQRKVALVIADLPFRINQLAAGPCSQFLQNSSLYELEPLDDQEVADALEQTFEHGGKAIERGALEQCSAALEGSPYLFQLVGYRTWAACRDGDTIREDDAQEGIRYARKEYEKRILDTAFRELSNGDLRFLTAMLDDRRESRLADISRRMGVKSNYTTKYKSRLLSQGVIEELGNNVFRFAIPGFRPYLVTRLEEMGELS